MRHLIKAMTLVAIIAAMDGARADEWNGCDSPDLERKIVACTKLIETLGIEPTRLAGAFIRRAYAYSRQGQYQRAIRDYDEAIRILPQDSATLNYRAIAYNNRATAYDNLGKPLQALPDAEKAVQFAPREPHFYATRGSIKQNLSDREGAIRDHDTAISLGGARWIKFYQCGLRLAQLYHGPLDGILRPVLSEALLMCVEKGSKCSPVPAIDPECPDPVG
jgi:tetratricopeptide (TPR) repeat protein